jgi:preprotein translocase subunit SecD
MRRNTILFLVILAVFIFAAFVVFPLSTSSGGLLFNRPIKLGLDLNGGVRLVYQADLTNVPEDERKEYMEADLAVIENRVNSLGAQEPVKKILGSDRILVEIPGDTDIDKATDLIGRTSILEFAEVVSDEDTEAKWSADGKKWKPATGTLNGETVELTSAYFKNNTYVSVDNYGQPYLAFEWTSDGSILSKEITTRLYNDNNALLGIFSGDDLISAPQVNGIIEDKGVIENIEMEKARELSKLLNAGRLSVPLNLLTSESVDSTLGSQFVDLSFKAALIGLGLIMLFMIIYYRLPGLMAALALLFYVMINLSVFKLVPITMTLGGIAGFVASMGMAVDANVLIFERMKEEMRAGRTVGAAIEAGSNGPGALSGL